ncbi:TPA: DNA-binding protein [Escherichia coli]|nr:DNA-binding protein [Escherichia coli]HEL8044726.1 DNA-binding protein [Escherichia coli]HEL8048048.1 DNA-binding protein [Escherichia coli]HEL8051576.1 DNA-binding protein [Escherichia coli]HEL8059105.1 DNA-binding protein [Escherichia coli]
MSVSKQNVFDACNELSVTNKSVTVAAVREITGGSFTTLAPLVKEWKLQESGAGELSAAAEIVPAEFTELVSALWSSAVKLANQRLESERRLLDDLRKQLDAERAELLASCDALVSQIDELNYRNGVIKEQNKQLTEVNAALTTENIRLSERLDVYENKNGLGIDVHEIASVLADIKSSLSSVTAAASPAPAGKLPKSTKTVKSASSGQAVM